MLHVSIYITWLVVMRGIISYHTVTVLFFTIQQKLHITEFYLPTIPRHKIEIL